MTDPGKKFLEMRQAMGKIGDQGSVNWRKEAEVSPMNFIDRVAFLMKQERGSELQKAFGPSLDVEDLELGVKVECMGLPENLQWQIVASTEGAMIFINIPDFTDKLKDVYCYKQYILDCELTGGMDKYIQDAKEQLVEAEKSVQEYVKSHPDKFTVDQETGTWKSIYFGKDLPHEG